MFKLENYSLRKRMYIVAGFGIIGLVVLAGLMFYMELNAVTSMQQLKVVLVTNVQPHWSMVFRILRKATSHKKLPFPVKVILAGWLLNSTVPAKMLLIWCTLLLVVSVN